MSLATAASRFIAVAVCATFLFGMAGPDALKAQQAPNVSSFLASPGQLLQQYPNGGTPLINAVQQIVLADPTTFRVLLGLLASANELQKGALGEGLAQAAKIEVLTNQPLATEWQQQIAAVTDPAFQTAALNAFGDVKLGAVGGGPLGGGGGGQTNPLSQGPSQNGSSPPNAPNPIPTPSFTFSSSTSAAAVVTSGTNGTIGTGGRSPSVNPVSQ